MNTQDRVPSLNYGTTSKQPIKSTPTFAFKDILRCKNTSLLFLLPFLTFFLFWISVTVAQHGIWQIFPEFSARIALLLVWIHVQVRELHSPLPFQPQPFPLEFPAVVEKNAPDNKTNQAPVFCTSLKSNQKRRLKLLDLMSYGTFHNGDSWCQHGSEKAEHYLLKAATLNGIQAKQMQTALPSDYWSIQWHYHNFLSCPWTSPFLK